VASLGRPRVLYVLWPEPVIVPGRGALVSELIGLAGGDSVTADSGAGYPRYSVEAAVARAPHLIIRADHGAGLDTLAREKWERLLRRRRSCRKSSPGNDYWKVARKPCVLPLLSTYSPTISPASLMPNARVCCAPGKSNVFTPCA
jgi:hypothetical protein